MSQAARKKALDELRQTLPFTHSRQFLNLYNIKLSFVEDMIYLFSGTNTGISYNVNNWNKFPKKGTRNLIRMALEANVPVFMDNGAFPAFLAGKPPPNFDWVMGIYDEMIAQAPSPDLVNIVGPDEIDEPENSFALLKKYQKQLVNYIRQGVRLILPIQADSYETFDQSMKIYQKFRTQGDSVVLGIPSRNPKLSKAFFRLYVEWWLNNPPDPFKSVEEILPRIHLLGMGTGSRTSAWLSRYMLFSKMILKPAFLEKGKQMGGTEFANWIIGLSTQEVANYLQCTAFPEMIPDEALRMGHPVVEEVMLSYFDADDPTFLNRLRSEGLLKDGPPNELTRRLLGNVPYSVAWEGWYTDTYEVVNEGEFIKDLGDELSRRDLCYTPWSESMNKEAVFSRFGNDSTSALNNATKGIRIPATGAAVQPLTCTWGQQPKNRLIAENCCNLIINRGWLEAFLNRSAEANAIGEFGFAYDPDLV